MDKRKFNRGTKGNKGGRKPKIEEIAVIEQMDAVAVPEKAWRALWGRVEEGDTNAIKCWIEYRFGKPKQSLDVTTNGENITVPPITWMDSD